jgi:hypothetical protein
MLGEQPTSMKKLAFIGSDPLETHASIRIYPGWRGDSRSWLYARWSEDVRGRAPLDDLR